MPTTADPALPFLEDALAGLPYTQRRMFGHDALFAAGNIFAIAWEGHATVKLPEASAFAEAMAIPGAAPFDPGRDGKGMARWVVLPQTMFDEPATLRELARRAHASAASASPKAPRRGANHANRSNDSDRPKKSNHSNGAKDSNDSKRSNRAKHSKSAKAAKRSNRSKDSKHSRPRR